MRNVSDESFRQRQKVFYVQKICPEKRAVYEIIGKI
jgi:hypothetical protein